MAGTVATRPCDPPAVAAAESVIEVELLMAWIVAPAGMPVPVTLSPTASPPMVPMPVTTDDPAVSTPAKADEGV